MLTGDKFETAKNIGFACKLITPDMHIWDLHDSNDVEKMFTDSILQKNDLMLKQLKKRGIVVESVALKRILEDKNFLNLFIQVAKTCEAVIAC